MSSGNIVEIIGAVVDVEFPRNAVPKIYDALTVDEGESDPGSAAAAGRRVVRAIAMGSTDGLKRGRNVASTGAPISVPVGKQTLGRIMNVLGEPVDDARARSAPRSTWRFTARPRTFAEQAAGIEILETGIKVIDLIMSVRQGRQGRPVRWRRRGQDRDVDGADPQHRRRPLRLTRCSPASASVPAKATTSIMR